MHFYRLPPSPSCCQLLRNEGIKQNEKEIKKKERKKEKKVVEDDDDDGEIYAGLL